MPSIRPRHDELIKKAFENPIVTKEFFEEHLPEDVKKLIDTNSLKLEKDSFIEKNLKKSFVDLLFSAKFAGEKGFVYLLLENQSQPDYWMSMRLFKYMLAIVEKHKSEYPESTKLPLVYPLVCYHGTSRYTAPRNLWDLFEKPGLAKKFWTEDHQLIDIHKIPDEELKSHLWSGTLQFFLKAVHHRDMLKAWHQIAELLPQMVKGEMEIGYDYIKILLHYSLTVMHEDDKIELEKVITNSLQEKGKEAMATIAKKLYQEGEHKGIKIGEAKGVKKTAINMLKQNFNDSLIKSVTGLAQDELDKLKSKI